MSNIFRENAPRYWARGLSVIPLQPRQKKPIPYNWSVWHDCPIPVSMQDMWLTQNPTSNIGMICGAQSGVTVIDIDTYDKEIEALLVSCLPSSPWCRVGQKGMILAYKYSGIKTFRIDDANGTRLVEYLSSKTQFVLPPSIHPDTQRPYVSNCELLDVIDQLYALPDDIEEVIRAKLAAKGVKLREKGGGGFKQSEKISAGARDTSMNRHAGFAATQVLRGELPLLQAINNMLAWAEEKVEFKEGDQLDIEKGCQQIISYLLSDVNTKNKILPNGWDEGLTDEQKKAWGLIFDDTQEEWTCEQILVYIDKVFTECGKDDPKRHTEIDFILKKMAKSINLTTMDIERIFKALKAGSGLTIPTFRNRLKELIKGPVEGLNHTSIAEAAIVELEKKGYKLRFYNSEFWTWEGTHWAPIEDGEIWKLIAREFGDLPAAKKASDHQGIMKVMAQLVEKKIKIIELDGVNFRNGFLTTDMKLVAHTPEFGMTYVMPYSYVPELAGRAYRFEQLLHNCWGHHPDFEQKKKALQEAMAITLFGKGPSFQRAILFYGRAGTGKSQILEVISSMVPKDAKSGLGPEQWDNVFSMSYLHEKLLNIAGELDEKKLIPGKQFKELVDGTEVTGQFKFKDPFNFKPKAIHFFGGNFLPKSRDHTNGFNRRWLIFNFDREVPESEKIVDLGKIIVSQEIEAIVAWAIEAYPEVAKRGTLTIPDSHKFHTREMGLVNSTIRQWMEQKLTDQQGFSSKEDDLYRNFFNFCISNGQTKVIQKQNFVTEFEQFLSEEDRKFVEFRENERVYLNIKLKDKN